MCVPTDTCVIVKSDARRSFWICIQHIHAYIYIYIHICVCAHHLEPQPHPDCVPGSRVLAIDRDHSSLIQACASAVQSTAGWEERVRVSLGVTNAEAMRQCASQGMPTHAVVFDWGVSSMQLDEAERGFSFRGQGPLDMRMQQQADGSTLTAHDIVNHWPEEEIRRLVQQVGWLLLFVFSLLPFLW